MSTPEPAPGLDDFDADDGALAFWHPVDDQELTETYLPAGTMAPGSSSDVRVRLKNTAQDYTAAAVTVTVTGPADPGAAAATGMVLLSADGDTFTAAADLGDLAAGQVSDPLTVRRIVAPGAAGNRYAYTLTAAAGAWAPAAAGETTSSPGAGNLYDPDAAQPPPDPEE